VLALPYLAGGLGGLLLARAAPTPALEAAPMWGFACGALTGCVLGVLAAFAGGPLGDGRLTAVGPSPWQVGLVATLEVGVAAAITAGVANWLRFRAVPAGERLRGAGAAARSSRAGTSRAGPSGAGTSGGGTSGVGPSGAGTSGGGISGAGTPGRQAGVPHPRQADDEPGEGTGHTIYLDPWAGEEPPGRPPSASRGPAALP
jgi:hypothetical protein